jgi:hypothetical protein
MKNKYKVGDIIKLDAILCSIGEYPLYTTVTEIDKNKVWFIDPEDGEYTWLDRSDKNMHFVFHPINIPANESNN